MAPDDFVTTAHIPAPVGHGVGIGGIAPFMGPFVSGLEKVQTILSLFAMVVDYRY